MLLCLPYNRANNRDTFFYIYLEDPDLFSHVVLKWKPYFLIGNAILKSAMYLVAIYHFFLYF